MRPPRVDIFKSRQRFKPHQFYEQGVSNVNLAMVLFLESGCGCGCECGSGGWRWGQSQKLSGG